MGKVQSAKCEVEQATTYLSTLCLHLRTPYFVNHFKHRIAKSSAELLKFFTYRTPVLAVHIQPYTPPEKHRSDPSRLFTKPTTPTTPYGSNSGRKGRLWMTSLVKVPSALTSCTSRISQLSQLATPIIIVMSSVSLSRAFEAFAAF